MSTKAEKDRQKQIQDKCQNLLSQMLRDEDNKYCVDCDAKGPRWASWNLGIFLCIRCAGIHRNLGVHISKVKSVNLDSWTPSQVVSLQQMGNSRARAVYEANLPETFRRPQTDSALESFIRAKYEAKKYIAQEWVPSPIPQVNWDKELDEENEKAKRKKRDSKNLSNIQMPVRKKVDNVIPQAIAKPTSSSPKSSHRHSNTAATAALQAPALLSLDTPTNDEPSTGEDLFTSFLSADDDHHHPQSNATNTNISSSSSGASNQTGIDTLNLTTTKRSEEEENFFNQTTNLISNNQQQQGAKLDKNSILALYSKGPQIQAQPPQQLAFSNAAGLFPTAGATTSYNCQPTQLFPSFNGVIQQHQQPIAPTQTHVFPQQQPHQQGPIINPASNPFYSMSSFQQNKLSEQMSNLTMGPTSHTTSQHASTMPGQTLTNNLWQ